MISEVLSNLFFTFTSMFISFVIGTFIIFIAYDNEISLPEFIGFSYIVGSGTTGALLGLSSVLLGRFNPWFVYSSTLISLIISVILWLKGKRLHIFGKSKKAEGFKYYEYPLILLIIFIIIVIIAGGISGGPNWDGLLTYGFIAKSLFLSKRIDMSFFTNAVRYGHIHLDYPLLLPLLEYWCYHFIGSVNYQLIQFISIGYYVALAFIFYGSLKSNTSRFIALSSLLIVLFNPIIISNSLGGDTDIIVATYLTGILILYANLLANPSVKTAFMLGLLTGFLANTKNEGFAFFVLFSLLLIFIPGIKKRVWFYYFIPSGILGLPWFITKLLYGIRSDLFIHVLQQIPSIKNRLLIMLHYYVHFFTGTFPAVKGIKGTGFLWLIVGIGFIIMFGYKSIRNRYGMLSLPFVLLFFIYSAVYLVTPHTIQWQLEYSFPRTMTQLAVPLLWLSTVILWERYAKES